MPLYYDFCVLCYDNTSPVEIPKNCFNSSCCECMICIRCWNECYSQGLKDCPVCDENVSSYLDRNYPLKEDSESSESENDD